jgi:hypothetical protein
MDLKYDKYNVKAELHDDTCHLSLSYGTKEFTGSFATNEICWTPNETIQMLTMFFSGKYTLSINEVDSSLVAYFCIVLEDIKVKEFTITLVQKLEDRVAHLEKLVEKLVQKLSQVEEEEEEEQVLKEEVATTQPQQFKRLRKKRKRDCRHGQISPSKCKICNPCNCEVYRLKTACPVCNFNNRFCQVHMERYKQCGCERKELKENLS